MKKENLNPKFKETIDKIEENLNKKQDNLFFDDEENVEYFSRKAEIFIFIACILVLFIFYCLLF